MNCRNLRRAALFATLVLGVAPGPAALAAEWQTFSSAEDGFSVEFPGTPARTDREEDVNLLSDHTYAVEEGGRAAVVQAARFVAGQAPGEDAGGNLLQSVLVESGCTPVTPQKLVGGDAIALAAASACEGGARATSDRLYIAGDRAFLLIFLGEAGAATDADAARFLGSFKIVGP